MNEEIAQQSNIHILEKNNVLCFWFNFVFNEMKTSYHPVEKNTLDTPYTITFLDWYTRFHKK